MEHIMNRSIIKEFALEASLCLLVVAAIPILALLGIALRGAIALAIVLGALLCVLLYPISERFREWFKAQAEIDYQHCGLRLARDVLLYPAHSWARWGKKAVTVGADDLLLSTVGSVDAVELPPPGTHAIQGQPLFRVRHGDRIVEVLSPVSGVVSESNHVLEFYPELMNESPFSEGWAVRLSPDDASRERRSLLHTRRARAWFENEVDRAIGSNGSAAQAAGGMRHRGVDPAVWNRVSKLFAQRSATLDTTIEVVE